MSGRQNELGKYLRRGGEEGRRETANEFGGRLKCTAHGHSHEGGEKKSSTRDDGLGGGTEEEGAVEESQVRAKEETTR